MSKKVNMSVSPNEAMSKSMIVWVSVSMSTTWVSMNLIVRPSDSVIVNVSLSINLNMNSTLGVIRYIQNEDDFQDESE